MRLVYARPSSPGWNVITVMVRLAAQLLEAELVVLDGSRPYGHVRRASGTLPRRRGRDVCLVVAPEPYHLTSALRLEHWTRGFAEVAGWVMDPWWDDRIPHVARTSHYDHLFVTEDELVAPWHERTGKSVAWVPTGSDVLGHGSERPDRSVDLQRIGRQPETWEDDAGNERAAREHGLTYAGRFPMGVDAESSMDHVRSAAAGAKFTLAFTNLLSPHVYTHPNREYLTGRWTDSLACGATVAGVVPDCRSARDLLWDGATLDLGSTDRAEGMRRLALARLEWTPEVPVAHRRQALLRLDWRWRFRTVATAMGVAAPRLDDALELVERAAAPGS